MDRNEWETPQWVYDYFDAQYHFTLDPCATHENAKCEKYFTKAENGLIQPWGEGFAFVNPPYGRGLLAPWVERCLFAALAGCGSVMLLPSRTDQTWFHRCVRLANEIIFIEGRINFLPPPGVDTSGNRENSIVVIVEPGATRTGLTISSIHVNDLKKGAVGNPRRRSRN